MNKLKYLLSQEAKYQLKEEVFDRLLGNGKLIRLNKYDTVIDTGEYCPDAFIVKNGIVRGTYMDKNVEVTTGFALPGTVILSFHCYYGEVGSFLRFEACCSTEVLRIPKAHFDALINESPEFAMWVLSISQNQLYYNEYRFSLLSGDARSRLKALLKRWSDIYPEMSQDSSAERFLAPVSHKSKVNRELTGRWRSIISAVPSRIIASYLGITEQHLSKIKKDILLEERINNKKS